MSAFCSRCGGGDPTCTICANLTAAMTTPLDDSRRPLPPEDLVDALHDTIHTNVDMSHAAHVVRAMSAPTRYDIEARIDMDGNPYRHVRWAEDGEFVYFADLREQLRAPVAEGMYLHQPDCAIVDDWLRCTCTPQPITEVSEPRAPVSVGAVEIDEGMVERAARVMVAALQADKHLTYYGDSLIASYEQYSDMYNERARAILAAALHTHAAHAADKGEDES